jgi:hypothetical protein
LLLRLKLLLVPSLIGLVTLAGRRWGPTIAGRLTALPVVSVPIPLSHALRFHATGSACALIFPS